MKITAGITWILAPSEHFRDLVSFFTDVMGMSIAAEGVPVTDTQFLRYAQIQMPNGVVLEIVEPVAELRRLYHAPIASFSVDDVGQARAEMEAKGVEFVSPLFDAGQGWGWTYFRAPDGNVYQLQGRYGSEQSPTTPTGVGGE